MQFGEWRASESEYRQKRYSQAELIAEQEELEHPGYRFFYKRIRERFQYSLLWWKHPMKHHYIEYDGIDIDAVIDRRNRNDDIPDIWAFSEQGLTHYDPPSTGMDRVDFTERCYVKGGKVYALYQQNEVDFTPPWHHNPATYKKALDIDDEMAFEFATVVQRLQLDRNCVRKMLYGYVTADAVSKPGLANAPGSAEYALELLDGIKATLPDDWEKSYEDFRAIAYNMAIDLMESGTAFESAEAQMHYIQRAADILYEEHQAVMDAVPIEDETPKGPPTDAVFNGRPLYHGDEGLPNSLIAKIKSMSISELKQFKSEMFPTEHTSWSGEKYTRRAAYWYLTPSQRSQAWVYIKARDKELLSEAERTVSAEVAKTLRYIRTGELRSMTPSYAYTHINGGTYDMLGQKIPFTTPTEGEILLIKKTLAKYYYSKK